MVSRVLPTSEVGTDQIVLRRPPLPLACAEPHPPRLLVPPGPGLDLCPPHPSQESHKPPHRPPLPLSPTATTTPSISASSKPLGTHCRRTSGRGPPSPRSCRPRRPGGGGEGRRIQLPVPPGIVQPLGRVPLHSHPSSLSSSSRARRGGSAGGGGCQAQRQRRRKRQWRR